MHASTRYCQIALFVNAKGAIVFMIDGQVLPVTPILCMICLSLVGIHRNTLSDLGGAATMPMLRGLMRQYLLRTLIVLELRIDWE